MPRTSDRRLIFWPSLTCSCFRRLLFGFRFTLRKWRIAGPGIPESGLPDAVYVTCGPGKLKKLKKRQRQQALNKRMLAGEWQQRWSFRGLKGASQRPSGGFRGLQGTGCGWLVPEVIQTQDKTRRQTIQDFELVIQNAGATINGIYGRSRFSASAKPKPNPNPKPSDRIQPRPK